MSVSGDNKSAEDLFSSGAESTEDSGSNWSESGATESDSTGSLWDFVVDDSGPEDAPLTPVPSRGSNYSEDVSLETGSSTSRGRKLQRSSSTSERAANRGKASALQQRLFRHPEAANSAISVLREAIRIIQRLQKHSDVCSSRHQHIKNDGSNHLGCTGSGSGSGGDVEELERQIGSCQLDDATSGSTSSQQQVRAQDKNNGVPLPKS